MSQVLRITKEIKEKLISEFLEKLDKAEGLKSDTFSFSAKVQSPAGDRASLLFTPNAWAKMTYLINHYSTEVGWHGIAKRGDDPSKNEYIISDILVYPQIVTGVTVTTDDKEYTEWLLGDDNEDVFNDIRMHGHSHVNMGVTPSSTDLDHWGGILKQFTPDTFYIFMIWNKKGEKTIKIYDNLKNVMFDTKDVDVGYYTDNFEDFCSKADEFVKERSAVAPKTKKYDFSKYGNSYVGYNNQYSGYDDYPYDSYGGYGCDNKLSPNDLDKDQSSETKVSQLTMRGYKKGKRK